MTKRKFVVSLFVVAVLVFAMSTGTTVVCSQTKDPIAKEHRGEVLYDQGVHAYFDHDYEDAISRLEQVEELDSIDPRPYFFLGLSYLKNDDNDNAEKYLKKAAKLEWTRRGVRDFDVAAALIRIQGKERVLVEKYRSQAKQEWQQTEAERRKVRYGTTKDNDKAILAAIVKQGPKEFVGQAPFGARSTDPFRTNTDDGEERLIKSDDAVPSVIIKEEVKEEIPLLEDVKTDATKTDVVKPDDEKKSDDEDPFGEDEKEDKPADEKKTEDNEMKSDDEEPSEEDEKEDKPADEKKTEDDEMKSDDEEPSEEDEKEDKSADEKKTEDDEKKSDDEDDNPFG
jgi:tetratricopeptide (TPR) repeat protein